MAAMPASTQTMVRTRSGMIKINATAKHGLQFFGNPHKAHRGGPDTRRNLIAPQLAYRPDQLPEDVRYEVHDDI
jgi:hypothetical protein